MVVDGPPRDWLPTPRRRRPLTRLVAQLLGGHHGRYPESPEEQLDPRIDHRLPEDAWDRQRDAYLHCVRHVLDAPPTPPRLDAPTAFSENTAPPSTSPRTCRIWSSRCTTTRHSRSTPNANTSASPRNSPTVVR